MPWRRLLDGADAERAHVVVEAIAAEIDRRAPEDPTFGAGQAGIAVMHGYRARAGRDDGADRAFAALERALANLAAAPRPWLFSGSAGVGFALHHLAEVVGDAPEVLADLDALVARALAIDALPWDLAGGCAGLGVYGLERGLPASVERAVHQVAACVERSVDGAAWRTWQPEHPEGHVNLGLAHGVASAIAFLAEAWAAGHASDDIAELVRDAMRWLRGKERAGAVPRYPMFHGAVALGFTATLDGWCYGDVSTALVLVRAGGALREPGWIDAGLVLARHAARRTDDQLARLAIDTSLCHGAISHAHMFNRLGQCLGDHELLAAARRWYARVLADDVLSATAEAGLQIGLAGIALGLLAGATSVEPAWDRGFLMSLPS